MKRLLVRLAEFIGSLFIAPVLLALAALALLLTDALWALFGQRRPVRDRLPDTSAASVVIPNWNGRDLLEKYLPSVVRAMAGNPANEIVVVDNGSSDGSVAFLRDAFPQVRVIALSGNLGFGGGSNAGFRAAKNDIVVLLNSDMRVEENFLAPLLAGFTHSDVFAVSCQIFLSDPEKRREETGLTEGWWEAGKLRVSHRHDGAVDRAFPCFYAGGGSSAFDRAKFLELGGFDDLLAPFYLEDTDLGFLAWKRGWKVFYQPASIVFHEHRGTIGRKFTSGYIDSILKKNYLLFAWKNMHAWPRLAASFFAAWSGAIASGISGDRPLRTNLRGIIRAFRQLPGASRSRWTAHASAVLNDAEAFARCRGSHFRDRFVPVATPEEQLRVMFVSPYPILPPVHGGAVFMSETLRELGRLCEVHALVLLDEPSQAPANKDLADHCASVELMVRPRQASLASMQPHAVDEFSSRNVRWVIDRTVYLQSIDIVQIEYTPMGQYIEQFQNIGTALFEHDIYFQSIVRTAQFFDSALARWKARFEYLRALRYELRLLARCDQVQVCTKQNRDYVLEFAPQLAPRLKAGLRAVINTRAYAFPGGPREPFSLLFIGSARHAPNKVAVDWFVQHVFAEVVAQCPRVRFYLAGFEAALHPEFAGHPNIVMLGYVENVKPLLASCSVFVCPILSGSGVRVKLLEAFAGGIPVISTRVGAEGLAERDGDLCALADDPGDFAKRTIELLETPEAASAMAQRAREEVETNWDGSAVTPRLEAAYRELLRLKRERARQS